jgi:hypothetical protein
MQVPANFGTYCYREELHNYLSSAHGSSAQLCWENLLRFGAGELSGCDAQSLLMCVVLGEGHRASGIFANMVKNCSGASLFVVFSTYLKGAQA